ncbi:Acg family FMN-binding oxidoreductase [Acidovorax lacteus]|uniref:Nitroreductase family protein n=1 Tax=Acidovorax lacteus TaxID=1924988 RepID=A0ABP8LB83_9BURK
MQRRAFIRLVGGGTVAAVALPPLAACSSSPHYPAAAIEAWQGPAKDLEPRRRAVAYAITAPNAHNRQPWRVDLRTPGQIVLHVDRERLLPHTDPLGRQILLSQGTFLEVLVMALAEQGLAGRVELWPQGPQPAALADWDDRPVARITVVPGGTPDPLFAQVLRRRTPKSAYDMQRPVDAALLPPLIASVAPVAGMAAGATVDASRLPALRTLCMDAARVEVRTPRTFLESLHLLRIGPDEILQHRDGISINTPMLRALNTLGLVDRQNMPAEGSTADRSALQRFEDHSRTAMGFVWIHGPNTRADQVRAGQAYLRLQLQATAQGLAVHPMSQALQEFAEMAPHFEAAHRLLLGTGAPRSAADPTLQMFCRIGYPAEAAPATPRRPVAALLQA